MKTNLIVLELVEAVRILLTDMMLLINSLYESTSDKELKKKLKDLGEDIGKTKAPKSK